MKVMCEAVLATWMIRSNVAATTSVNHTPDRFIRYGIILCYLFNSR